MTSVAQMAAGVSPVVDGRIPEPGNIRIAGDQSLIAIG